MNRQIGLAQPPKVHKRPYGPFTFGWLESAAYIFSRRSIVLVNTGGNRLRNLSECRVGMVGNEI